MPIGGSDGTFYEDEFSFAKDRPRVYITKPDVEDRREDPYATVDLPSKFEEQFGIHPKDFFFGYPAGKYTSNPMAKGLGYNDISSTPVDTLEYLNTVENTNDPFKGGQLPVEDRPDLPTRRPLVPSATSGRFPFSSDTSTMPSGGPTEPAGAFKSSPGMVAPGNIDLSNRPVVKNEDGSISTVRSMSANFDGKEVLIPTVAHDGSRILSDKEAIQQYKDTGKHLGMFDSPEAATSYAEQLHKDQEKQYVRPEPYGLNPPEREGGGKYLEGRPSLVGIVKGLWNSIKEAGSLTETPPWAMDETTGEFHTNPKAIERAADLAGWMTFGPSVVAGKAADGTLGSFIGAKAKTFDMNNNALARILEKRGVDSDEILRRTGMFRGADRHWRSEISDKAAEIDTSVLKSNRMTYRGEKEANLEDFYKHPELYEAYPELKNIKVYEDINYDGIAEADGRVIRYNPKRVKASGMSLKEIVAHETQHIIQDIEGFARGGAPLQIENKATDLYRLKHQLDEDRLQKIRDAITSTLEKHAKGETLTDAEIEGLGKAGRILDTHRQYISAANQRAFENYQRLAGEVEARNVQSRLDLSPEELRLYPPSGSMDTKAAKQIMFDTPPGTTAYGVLAKGGLHIPVPPAMKEPTTFRRAANENLPAGHPDRVYDPAKERIRDRMEAQAREEQRISKMKDVSEEIRKLEIKDNLSEFEKSRLKKLEDTWIKSFESVE